MRDRIDRWSSLRLVNPVIFSAVFSDFVSFLSSLLSLCIFLLLFLLPVSAKPEKFW